GAGSTNSGRSRSADRTRWARGLETDSYWEDGGGLYARSHLCHVRWRLECRGSGGRSKGACTGASIWAFTRTLSGGRREYHSVAALATPGADLRPHCSDGAYSLSTGTDPRPG